MVCCVVIIVRTCELIQFVEKKKRLSTFRQVKQTLITNAAQLETARHNGILIRST